MNIEFDGRAVFLTGAGRGIGKKIKEMFLENGAEVIAPSHEELALEDEGVVEGYLKAYNKKNPDIFIHCAGINRLAGIEKVDQELLQEVMQVNCFSAVRLLRKFIPGMKEKKYGRVVLISSLYAIISRENRIAYSASKNAMTGIMKSIALETAADNILLNAVAPGYVMTDMTKRNLSGQEIKDIQQMIPTGRFQTETDIASLVCFLCSQFNQSITGQLIAVDGGFTCK